MWSIVEWHMHSRHVIDDVNGDDHGFVCYIYGMVSTTLKRAFAQATPTVPSCNALSACVTTAVLEHSV